MDGDIQGNRYDTNLKDTEKFNNLDISNIIVNSEVPQEPIDDMQLTFSMETVLDMSNEELLDIIAEKTKNGTYIFFDDIISIDDEKIILKNEEEIIITSNTKYKELVAKQARHKLFRVMHDPESTMASIQKVVESLERKTEMRLSVIEDQIQLSVNDLATRMKVQTDKIEQSLISAIQVPIQNLQSTAETLNVDVDNALIALTQKIKNIDDTRVAVVIDKLSEITDLLAEVTE